MLGHRALERYVRPLTSTEWHALLESAGLTVVTELWATAPMHLLEATRLVRDEGLFRAIRFAWNVAWNPAARRRVLAMRFSASSISTSPQLHLLRAVDELMEVLYQREREGVLQLER